MKYVLLISILGLFLISCTSSAVHTSYTAPSNPISEVVLLDTEIVDSEIVDIDLEDSEISIETLDEIIPDIDEIEDDDKLSAYEVGHILVIMYHGITDNESSTALHRSAEDFRMDLQRLYDNNYRLITIQDLVYNNITLEAGYSPVIITFDDGLSSSFSLIEEDGVLMPKPDTGVDVIMKFAEDYPDFGRTAVFYVNGNPRPFSGAGTLTERFEFLIEHGFELGNHTYSHVFLSQIGAEDIQKEFAKVESIVREATPDYTMYSVAYPYGERPLPQFHDYILNGSYEDITYEYILGLRAGYSSGQTAPNRVGFDPLNIPRIQGSDGYYKDLHWFLDYYEENPQYRYVSDGNPDRISVPERYLHNVNQDSLGDKELFIIDPIIPIEELLRELENIDIMNFTIELLHHN